MITIVTIVCFKGIHIHHEMGSGKQNITLPESNNVVEIPRLNGKEPFRFNIKTPERKIIIEKP